MIKINNTQTIRENEMTFIEEVKQGLLQGLSLSYIFDKEAHRLKVPTHSVREYWYSNRCKEKLDGEYKVLIGNGKKKATMTKEIVPPNEKPKETVGKKIYTLVKQTNVDLSHLQELYSIQGEELKLQLKKGFKKIEDNQNSFSQSVSNKLNKMMQLDQPQTIGLDTPSAKFVVDYKSDVKVLEAPVELKYDEAKVNGLINEIEGLEETNKTLMNDLEFEMDLRRNSENKFDMLRAEANFMKEELDKLKGELQYERELNSSISNCNLELEQQIIRLNRENVELVNKNKLLNKRGLVDRLFNRDVEYSPVSN